MCRPCPRTASRLRPLHVILGLGVVLLFPGCVAQAGVVGAERGSWFPRSGCGCGRGGSGGDQAATYNEALDAVATTQLCILLAVAVTVAAILRVAAADVAIKAGHACVPAALTVGSPCHVVIQQLVATTRCARGFWSHGEEESPAVLLLKDDTADPASLEVDEDRQADGHKARGTEDSELDDDAGIECDASVEPGCVRWDARFSDFDDA